MTQAQKPGSGAYKPRHRPTKPFKQPNKRKALKQMTESYESVKLGNGEVLFFQSPAMIIQSHEIITDCDPIHVPLQLERIGRTCYKSEEKIGAESARKFITKLIESGHEAMLEFFDITVRFITNRGVTHELVRHRLCSYAQESTRYINYSKKPMTFIIPCWLEADFKSEEQPSAEMMLFVESCLEAQRNYIRLIKEYNWHPQQAREVLPNSLKTEIVIKANIREWRHIFRLRCSKPAHPQMRALMEPLRQELQGIFPYFFNDIL